MKYEPDRAKRKEGTLLYALDDDFNVAWYDLDPWPRDFNQGDCTFFDQRHYVGEVWSRLDQREKIWSGQDEGQQHPLPKGPLEVKSIYEPNVAMGREYMNKVRCGLIWP